MEEKEKLELQRLLVDVLTEMPVQFNAGGKLFNIFPKSFGVKLLIDNLKSQLNVNEENVKINPNLECLRVCQEKQKLVLRMIAYATTYKKREILDANHIAKRIEFFRQNLELSDMATLLLHILKDDSEDILKLKKHLKISNEEERKCRVAKYKKKDGGSVSFGGVSIYGSMIAFFAETFGWSLEYIMWEVSYANLMLLYSDHIVSIFLSEDERKKVPSRLLENHTDSIDASDPKNREKILEMIKNGEFA